MAPLADLVRSSIAASAVFIYQLDATGTRLGLRFADGSVPPSSIGQLAVEFAGEQALSLRNLRTLIDVDPLSDATFEKLPEVLQYRFGRLLVAPLCNEDRLLGLFTAGRIGNETFDDAALERVGALAHALGSAFTSDALRTTVRLRDSAVAVAQERITELERKLEERKLVERAKGILQQQGATEEDAFLTIRRTSRQRRVVMAEVAREIIAAKETALRMSA